MRSMCVWVCVLVLVMLWQQVQSDLVPDLPPPPPPPPPDSVAPSTVNTGLCSEWSCSAKFISQSNL